MAGGHIDRARRENQPEVQLLTVEDDDLLRGSIVRLLEACGYRMHQAGDGASALEVFARVRPDVVLCDLRLPDMSGHDVIAAIHERSPETPVIVVSGAEQMDDAILALREGAWDFISKPVLDIDLLDGTVRRALEHLALSRENQQQRQHLEVLNRELSRALVQLRDEVQAGHKVQLKLLPEDGVTLAGHRFERRLFPSAYLSGDFVDYFALGERHAGFYMADVSGHGAASAFVTVMLKSLMSQYIGEHARIGEPTLLRPADTLQRLDADLRRLQVDRHVGMVYGTIDAEAGTLTFAAGAAYPYPLLWDGQRCVVLEQRGRPLGLCGDHRYRARTVELPARASLLVASDGVLDFMGDRPAEAKEGALRDALVGHGDSIDRLAAALGVAGASSLPDDVALLLITRREPS